MQLAYSQTAKININNKTHEQKWQNLYSASYEKREYNEKREKRKSTHPKASSQ